MIIFTSFMQQWKLIMPAVCTKVVLEKQFSTPSDALLEQYPTAVCGIYYILYIAIAMVGD